MDRLNVQQNSFVACEETRIAYVSDRRESLICPKPRRLDMVINNPVRPLTCYTSYEPESCQSKTRNYLLDMILTKECNDMDQFMTCVASSPPPYFCGSPPSRSANPLTKDSRFGNEKIAPLCLLVVSSPSSMSSQSSSSSSRIGGCFRSNFGFKPTVRVEGFDCLNRDRQNSSISAVA